MVPLSTCEERIAIIRRELRLLTEDHSVLTHARDSAYARGLRDALRIIDAEMRKPVGTLLEARMAIDGLLKCRN